MELQDRGIIVCGAAGGIGSAIARRVASAGARVALCDINADALRVVTDELERVHYSAQLDVRDDRQIAEFCRSASDALGSLDALVYACGVVDVIGDAESLPIAEWNRALEINLNGAFYFARHAIPHLSEGAGGSIVNIASISGIANQEKAMAYSVSKAGMIALTRSLAIDFASRNIRANSVCPGSVDTHLVQKAAELVAAEDGRTPDQVERDWKSQYPNGRFSTPQEIADACAFLLSDSSSAISGTALVVDGGLMALLPER